MTSTFHGAAQQVVAGFADSTVEDNTGLAWKREGLCTQTDPELFYPTKGNSSAVPKRICDRCPVRPACLDHAIKHREPHGIWGGRTAGERRRMIAIAARAQGTAA